jgi:hypothetical protein
MPRTLADGKAARLVAAGIAFACAVLLALAGPARAASPSWLEVQPIELGGNAITGLSCPLATTCLAASSSAIVQDGGPSYEPVPDPDPSSEPTAVSCAPGTRFCMFVDANGGGFTYTDGSFGTRSDFDAANALESVSCPSSGFCMAIDHSHKVWSYSNGAWGNGTTLPVTNFSNFTNVSCASSSFCVALASTDNGEVYFTWNGSTWSSHVGTFDTSSTYALSLSCPSVNSCLETSDKGYASVYNGTAWSSKRVDTNGTSPLLHSSCVGTFCMAMDYQAGYLTTSDFTTNTWTSRVDVHSDTLLGYVSSLACVTATLCVAGDAGGEVSTYAVPPAPGKPMLSGTPTVGQTLGITHAPVQQPAVWYAEDWRRCDNPDAGCTFDPISSSTSGYTLVAADAGKYIDAREFFGFAFYQDGPNLSSIVGPVSDGSGGTGGTGSTGSSGSTGSTTSAGDTGTDLGSALGHPRPPGTARLSGTAKTTASGLVTIVLSCSGGPCKGSVTLAKRGTIGSARYSIAAGRRASVKIHLTASGKKLLKRGRGKLTVTLVIATTGERPHSGSLKLKVRG